MTPTDPAWREKLHRPLRPRAGRYVSYGFAIVWVVVFTSVTAGFPPLPGTGVLDRLAFLLVALAGGFLLYRLGAVAVLPSEGGVVVRNIGGSTRLDWAEVVQVRFDSGSTWCQLDLSDGTSVNALGIQGSDGAHAQRDAVRLATLVELHQRSDRG